MSQKNIRISDSLKRFEEPGNFGCAGLIFAILLTVLCDKCSSCSGSPIPLGIAIEQELIEKQVKMPAADFTVRRIRAESEIIFEDFSKNEK